MFALLFHFLSYMDGRPSQAEITVFRIMLRLEDGRPSQVIDSRLTIFRSKAAEAAAAETAAAETAAAAAAGAVAAAAQ